MKVGVMIFSQELIKKLNQRKQKESRNILEDASQEYDRRSALWKTARSMIDARPGIALRKGENDVICRLSNKLWRYKSLERVASEYGVGYDQLVYHYYKKR